MSKSLERPDCGDFQRQQETDNLYIKETDNLYIKETKRRLILNLTLKTSEHLPVSENEECRND